MNSSTKSNSQVPPASPKLPQVQTVIVSLDSEARGWVYYGDERGVSEQAFQRPVDIEPGAVLCDVVISSICGSDLHTLHGRRDEPTPLILGHEIVGRVATIGAGGASDWHGGELKVGDLVTWSIIVACDDCFYCNRGLPQKCERLHKYGHCSCEGEQPLTGGFADAIMLKPGSAIFKVPEALSPETVVPANCVLATAFNAVDEIDLIEGETVLIQGAGLLGLYLSAIAKARGAKAVIVADINPGRLRLADRFGADAAIDLSQPEAGGLKDVVMAHTSCRGVDVAFEACGSDAVIEQGVRLIRKGGRYVIAGLVTSSSRINIPADLLTKCCLTVKGIHNYRPEHLAKALAFLEDYSDRFPFHEIVGKTFLLDDFKQAVEAASSGKYLRVALRPGTKARPKRIGVQAEDAVKG